MTTEQQASQIIQFNASNVQELIAMARELRRDNEPIEMRDGKLIVSSFDAAVRVSRAWYASGLVPEHVNSWEKSLVVLTTGLGLGLDAGQSYQNLYIVNNRVTIFGDAVPGLIFSRAMPEDVKETFENLDKHGNVTDESVAVCIVKRKDIKSPFECRFSMRQANDAGLWPTENRKSAWFKYPKRMLQMRARQAYRDAYPDVLKGLWIAEEFDVTQSNGTVVGIADPVSDSAKTKQDALDAAAKSLKEQREAVIDAVVEKVVVAAAASGESEKPVATPTEVAKTPKTRKPSPLAVSVIKTVKPKAEKTTIIQPSTEKGGESHYAGPSLDAAIGGDDEGEAPFQA